MSTEFAATKYLLQPSMPFNQAVEKWMKYHSPSIRPSTVKVYYQHVKVLKEFFKDLPLGDIDPEKLREYQKWRSQKAGATKVNHEFASILQAVLKHAGLWRHLEDFYKPMKAPSRRAGHSLTAEDEMRLREAALSHPRRRVAGHSMIIMLSTTMGFGELRQLRRRDVDMEKRCVTIQDGAKNIYRERTIPLNNSAFESMRWILDRFEKLGGSGEDEFILPHNAERSEEERRSAVHKRTSPPDFSRPMEGIYKAARNICKAAGLEHFRLYDCRVQAITKLLSNPTVAPQVSREIAGHVSQAIQNRYSIQQFDTKKRALDAIDSVAAVDEEVKPIPLPPPPPQYPVPAPIHSTTMQSLIEAEIARQVAQALEAMKLTTTLADPAREQRQVASAGRQLSLLQFPR